MVSIVPTEGDWDGAGKAFEVEETVLTERAGTGKGKEVLVKAGETVYGDAHGLENVPVDLGRRDGAVSTPVKLVLIFVDCTWYTH